MGAVGSCTQVRQAARVAHRLYDTALLSPQVLDIYTQFRHVHGLQEQVVAALQAVTVETLLATECPACRLLRPPEQRNGRVQGSDPREGGRPTR